jgi:hypothetical protein
MCYEAQETLKTEDVQIYLVTQPPAFCNEYGTVDAGQEQAAFRMVCLYSSQPGFETRGQCHEKNSGTKVCALVKWKKHRDHLNVCKTTPTPELLTLIGTVIGRQHHKCMMVLFFIFYLARWMQVQLNRTGPVTELHLKKVMNNTYQDKMLRDKMYRDKSNRYKTHPPEVSAVKCVDVKAH